jgi:hypothetical protein
VAIGLIYGKITGLLRRVIVTDDISQLPLHVGPGEAIVTVSVALYATFGAGLDAIQSYLNSIIGIVPSGYRSVMIDAVGNVSSIHHADPGCDHPHPGKRLIWSELAQVGMVYVNSQFMSLSPMRRRSNSARRKTIIV